MAIITVCRGTKSGGRAMAECLAEKLDYPILGREVVQHAAEELGVSHEMLERKMWAKPTLWDRFTSMRKTYLVAVQAALAEHAAEGKLVYHGLAGGFIMQDAPCTLCLRLIAPMERRIRVVVEESGISPEMAERYIREIDDARARWVEVMYDIDLRDPALYDLIINLDTITVDGACSLTARAIDHPEFELTDGVRRELEDFRLACRVRLALVQQPELRSFDLAVRVEGSTAILSGAAPVYRSGRMGHSLSDIARSVPGIDDVRVEFEWFDPYP